MEILCNQKDYEGHECDGLMFEVERSVELERENITDKLLKCEKCGYEQLTMRRTTFSGAIEPHAF